MSTATISEQTDTRPLDGVPVLEGELVTVDTAIVPYITEREKLETMVRDFASYSATAAVLRVASDDDKALAVRHIRNWKTARKRATDFFTPVKQSIDAVKKIALDMEKHALSLIDGPVLVTTGKVTAYDAAVAKEQEERRQRLVKAEAERLRLEAATERARIEEQAAIDAMLAAEFGQDEPAPLPADVPMTETALMELAAVNAPAPQEAAKVDGFYYVPTHHFEITSLDRLIDAVLAGTVPRRALMADESFVRAQANAMGADLAWPGVRVWTTQEPRSRRA